MRTRRDLLAALLSALGASSLDLFAQEGPRVWRVGILAPSRRPDLTEGLLQGFRELGYVEGKNLAIELRDADGDYERLPRFAEELVRQKVDVLVTTANPGCAAALNATKTIPVLFTQGDPVGQGYVKSLARPGGNATGLSVFIRDLVIKHLQMLTGMVAATPSRFAVLMNPGNRGHRKTLGHIQSVFGGAQTQIIPVEAATAKDLESAGTRMSEEKVHGFIWIADPLFDAQVRQIADMALRHRLLSIAENPTYAEAGGLVSYGSSPRESWKRLAAFADKIFKGANPGDLPVEQPTKIHLVLNRKTANAIGFTFSPELLLLADKVIE